ncbi:MAG: hypothetical protein WKF61_03740 [Luteimonas sp.]
MTHHFNAPAPGDIVWCQFPNVDSIQPWPKPRPALVLSVEDKRNPARVRVAYGTSRKLAPMRKGAFVISQENPDAWMASGLYLPTKFGLGTVVLDYTSTWFALAPMPGGLVAPSPRMGYLHPTMVTELQRACVEAGLIKQ